MKCQLISTTSHYLYLGLLSAPCEYYISKVRTRQTISHLGTCVPVTLPGSSATVKSLPYDVRIYSWNGTLQFRPDLLSLIYLYLIWKISLFLERQKLLTTAWPFETYYIQTQYKYFQYVEKVYYSYSQDRTTAKCFYLWNTLFFCLCPAIWSILRVEILL